MNLGNLAGAILILAPITLAAQAGVGGGAFDGQLGHALETYRVAQPGLCPMSLRAKHLSDGDVVKTGGGAAHDLGTGQRLHLTLKDPKGKAMVSASVVVEGWTPGGHAEEAAARRDGEPAGHGQRNLTTPLTAEADGTAAGDLWAPGLTSVDWVELRSIAYADGSTWTPPSAQACRVAPDPFMLVTVP